MDLRRAAVLLCLFVIFVGGQSRIHNIRKRDTEDDGASTNSNTDDGVSNTDVRIETDNAGPVLADPKIDDDLTENSSPRDPIMNTESDNDDLSSPGLIPEPSNYAGDLNEPSEMIRDTQLDIPDGMRLQPMEVAEESKDDSKENSDKTLLMGNAGDGLGTAIGAGDDGSSDSKEGVDGGKTDDKDSLGGLGADLGLGIGLDYTEKADIDSGEGMKDDSSEKKTCIGCGDDSDSKEGIGSDFGENGMLGDGLGYGVGDLNKGSDSKEGANGDSSEENNFDLNFDAIMPFTEGDKSDSNENIGDDSKEGRGGVLGIGGDDDSSSSEEDSKESSSRWSTLKIGDIFVDGGYDAERHDSFWRDPTINPDYRTLETSLDRPPIQGPTFIKPNQVPGMNTIEVSTVPPIEPSVDNYIPPANPDERMRAGGINPRMFDRTLENLRPVVDAHGNYVDGPVNRGEYVDLSIRGRGNLMHGDRPGPDGAAVGNYMKGPSEVKSWSDSTLETTGVIHLVLNSGKLQGLKKICVYIHDSPEEAAPYTTEEGQPAEGLQFFLKSALEDGIITSEKLKIGRSGNVNVNIPDGATDIGGRIESQFGPPMSEYTPPIDPQPFRNDPREMALGGDAMGRRPSRLFLAISSQMREAERANDLRDRADQLQRKNGGIIRIFTNQPDGSKKMQQVLVNFRQPSLPYYKDTEPQTVRIPSRRTTIRFGEQPHGGADPHDHLSGSVHEVSLPNGDFHVHSHGDRHVVHDHDHAHVDPSTHDRVLDIINQRESGIGPGSFDTPFPTIREDIPGPGVEVANAETDSDSYESSERDHSSEIPDDAIIKAEVDIKDNLRGKISELTDDDIVLVADERKENIHSENSQERTGDYNKESDRDGENDLVQNPSDDDVENHAILHKTSDQFKEKDATSKESDRIHPEMEVARVKTIDKKDNTPIEAELNED